MRAVHRATLAGTLAAWLLSGCGLGGYSDTYSGTLNPNALGGGTSSGGGSGSPAPPAGFPPGASGNPTGSHDTVVATASIEGSFTVKAGASGTLTLSFASSDDRTITGFALSGNALPAGWSGLEGYSCTLLGAGRTCVVSLSYAPTAPESGTLTLDFVFIDNAGQPRAPGGSVQIAYAASSTDNVLATVAPAGFVAAAPGTQQSVAVAFNTDDGDAATGFYIVDDLSALPAGWHSNAVSFACGIVSTGNGCVLPLSYAPSGAASGVLALHYAYTDHSGASRTGVVDLPYGPGSGGHVVADVAPGGQVNAVEMTGAQPVTVSFSSQDGRAASRLVLLSSLKSLPAGWSTGASGLSCASVGGGPGCSLALRYAPKARGRGVLSLEYAYLDAAGAYTVGLAQVPYASTTNDSVAATVLPAGPVVAIAA